MFLIEKYAGMEDKPEFQLYGWEDLELGVRLKQLGLKLIKCPEAVGYHWHPPFALDRFYLEGGGARSLHLLRKCSSRIFNHR